MNFDFDLYNLVLSEISARIASDQLIIEDVINNSNTNLSKVKTSQLISRNKCHIFMLSELIFIGRHKPELGLKNTSLIDSIQKASKIFDSRLIEIETAREKPLVDVIGEKSVLVGVIKILLSMLILESPTIKKLKISFRRRGDFVTVKLIGGKSIDTKLFYRDFERLLNNILGDYSSTVRFTIKSSTRQVFLRMHLSNQISIGYNK